MELKNVAIHSDNRSAIYLVYNLSYHEQTKHIDIKCHFIRDVMARDNVVVKKIATMHNATDMMTKRVPLTKLKLGWSSIGVCRE